MCELKLRTGQLQKQFKAAVQKEVLIATEPTHPSAPPERHPLGAMLSHQAQGNWKPASARRR